MQHEIITFPGAKLVGISVRTNNTNEMNPATGKIGPLYQAYFEGKVANKIAHRKNPGTTVTIYTDYASDEHGDYTFFIGELVTEFADVANGLQTKTIEPGKYFKLTTAQGPCIEVIVQAWQHIWQLTPTQLGGKRAFKTDFEVYDERASDPTAAIADIYIGIDV